MIPYKWMDLTIRDQTGVLLGNIHRKESKTQNAADVGLTLFTVPAENGFLLTSWSIECTTAGPTIIGERAELNILDKQGNTLSSMTNSLTNYLDPISGLPFKNQAITITGSPIALIGPGLQIQMRGRWTGAAASNKIEVSINGVLIPRGTMAFQQ